MLAIHQPTSHSGNFENEPSLMFNLFKACKENDINSVRWILMDPFLDPQDDIDGECITTVCANGNLEILNLLLRNGFDPSAGANQALYTACDNGHPQIVRELLRDGRIDPTDAEDQVLDIACQNENLEVIKELIRDPRIPSSVALVSAWLYGTYDLFQKLIKDELVDPSDGSNHVFRYACVESKPELAKALLRESSLIVNDWLLHIACTNGEREIVKILLQDERIDPTAQGNLAILTASREGRSEIVKTLFNDRRVRKSLTQLDYEQIVFDLLDLVK